jgi:hypothetical protein
MARRGGVQLSNSTHELKVLFDQFDADGSGSISVAEMEQCAERLGIELSKDQIDVLLLDFDSDGSGMLEFDEFCQLVQRAKQGAISEMIANLKHSYLDERAIAAGAGDCEWYTDEMIVKREGLKNDPKVQAALLSAWDSCSQSGCVYKEGYLEMIRKIYLVLKAQVRRSPVSLSPFPPPHLCARVRPVCVLIYPCFLTLTRSGR